MLPTISKQAQPDLSMVKPDQFFAPGIVIDIAARAEVDADTTLTLQDIHNWEKKHGQIPDGAIVLLHTGWGRFWDNYSRYKNQDARGKLHFPSYSGEAAKFLIHDRKAKGLGVDNLSIDRGISKDFAVHHIVNKAGKYGLENVAMLRKAATSRLLSDRRPDPNRRRLRWTDSDSGCPSEALKCCSRLPSRAADSQAEIDSRTKKRSSEITRPFLNCFCRPRRSFNQRLFLQQASTLIRRPFRSK